MSGDRTVTYPADATQRVADRLQDEGLHWDAEEAMELATDLVIDITAAVEKLRARERHDGICFTILWARSDRYRRPQLVAAWSDGYTEAYADAYRQERDEKIGWFRDFGHPSDGPWSFWTTTEYLPTPSCDHAFQRHPESEDAGVCSHCGAEELVA